MRVHLVFAHPSPKSFAGAIRDRVVSALEAAGHEVDGLDLYAAGFNPVLSQSEWSAYLDVGANLDGVSEEAKRLQAAEALVLIFPTWWYGVPAILKGWFDRVWVPGVAFQMQDGGAQIRPGLTNIRHLAVVTTHGAPWWFILWLGSPAKTVLTRALGRLLAPGARTRFLALYDIDRASRPKLERFLAHVQRSFRSFGR